MITAKNLILYTTLTLSSQHNTIVTAASLQNIERQTKVFVNPDDFIQPSLDLTQYGYNYVHNSSDTNLLEWISWPPSNEGGIDTTGKSIQYNNTNTIDECASKCQDDNAGSGSWQPLQGYCYCYFFNPNNLITNSNGDIVPETEALCREPCLEYEYIDFSIDIDFDTLDYCKQSSCDWYYDIIGDACSATNGFDKGACGDKLALLNVGTDNPTGSPSGSVRRLCFVLCLLW